MARFPQRFKVAVNVEGEGNRDGVVKPKDSARVQWVKPRLVCEVAFQEWTSDGKLRAPAFLGLREDKVPTEVVREVAITH